MGRLLRRLLGRREEAGSRGGASTARTCTRATSTKRQLEAPALGKLRMLFLEAADALAAQVGGAMLLGRPRRRRGGARGRERRPNQSRRASGVCALALAEVAREKLTGVPRVTSSRRRSQFVAANLHLLLSTSDLSKFWRRRLGSERRALPRRRQKKRLRGAAQDTNP